ncbi:MerR family transcriptional regulator [Fructilactobacillus fructivorans]|uniref:MerR family transcriptional regulator n=1 Tax=Fructilactobacillus fructivorans TaxID=1614 RepID=UPI00223B0B83|nr:MerR family transcriptional regulator [Fructilactobacillus fructivorans]MCT0151497.1 MerR family transcriptional regulator [Fructilactobacillus fructivorans]MCT2867016.1 MerR family transcriptional regulator [Fructilactobacillus fructivorans]MCT2869317.1 MerR family transcriptional regulator [Fructilactobacillus fructivorans]MCT2873646.1 MerR family transcriptional regulator [Fructilactobacillus fructivorans]
MHDTDDKLISSFNMQDFIFRIGEVSKMTGVSPRQLRYWEKKGYVKSTRVEKLASRVFDFSNFVLIKLMKYYLDDGYTLTTAYQKATQFKSRIAFLYSFFKRVDHGCHEVDGKRMADMGYFDDAHTKRLYGYIGDNGDVKYRVKTIED